MIIIIITMKKDYLRYILSVLAHDLEALATSEQVNKFKQKHQGMKWQKTLESDLLNYANNTLKLERWIENVITFMIEHNIRANINPDDYNYKKY